MARKLNNDEIVPNNKRIAKNTIFLYIRLAFVMLLSLYTVRVVLNALGVVDYGIYNVVGGFASMFGFFCTTMSSATQRFYNYEIGKNGFEASNSVYNAAIRIQLFFSLIVIVLGELIGVWYINYVMVVPAERLFVANWIYQFTLFSLVFTILQVPYAAAVMAYERMSFYAIIGIVDTVLKLCIAICIAHVSFDRLFVYGFLLFTISVLNFFLYYFYCKRNFPHIKLGRGYNRTLRNEMLSFSGWNLFGTFAYMMRNQGLNVLVNSFFGAVINAANGIAGQISGALQTFTSNIIIAFKPQLVQAYANGNYQRTYNLFFIMSKVSYAMALVVAIPIILEMPYILQIWLGNEIPAHTSSLSTLTIISILISVFHTPIAQVMHATGRIKKYQVITSLIILLILPLSWCFLKLGMAPEVIYWVTIVVFIANQIIGLRLLHENFSYNYFDYAKQVFLPCVLFSIIMILVPLFTIHVLPSSFVRLLLLLCESVIVGALSSFFVILTRDERLKVTYIVKSKIFKK